MDPRPIGIFDSGLGGLTAAKALETLLPEERLIYFGDSANAPYGIRSPEELEALASYNMAFLLRHEVKAILVACGTVSSTVVSSIRKRCPVPLFDVLEAPCRAAAASGARRVAVAATEASIRSGAFPRRLKALDGNISVYAKACQSLVSVVERGHFRPGDREAEEAVAAEFAPIREWKPELLLLACTHFPLLDEIISAYLGPEIRTLSVSREAAAALGAYLREHGQLRLPSPTTPVSSSRWFTSGEVERFAAYASLFLGRSVAAEVEAAAGFQLL